MIEEFKFNFNTSKLKKIAKAWAKNPWVKVGILQGDDKRGDGQSNTEIASYHEFGTSVKVGKTKRVLIPERSFLRMPIIDDYQNVWDQYAKTPEAKEDFAKHPKKFLNKMGQIALQVIDDAFANGGSSRTKWASLKPSTLSQKTVNQILVETGQLRDSISYEIVDGGA